MAVVDPQARLADDVEVGPFCVVGPHVTLGAGCKLLPHATVMGHTTLGEKNVIHPHAVIGSPPQDLKYAGEPTQLIIGAGNTIRESVTINTGTTKDKRSGGVTRVGDHNLFMVNAHIGHDCHIGSRCVIANNVMLAGHVVIGDAVIMNGLVGINQFVTVGDLAYLAGAARIHHDVPPFVKVEGDDRVRACNSVGLKRAGFSEADIEAIEEAVRTLFLRKEKPLAIAMKEFNMHNGVHPMVKSMIQFIERRNSGKHGRYLESLRGK
jgi:UDP-N-acetylglucosamine acyltransferase